MKKENTATRLKEIMNKRNLRQVDILNLTLPYCEKYDVKMNKSDISQYCSGKTEPNQDKLYVLGAALNINEAWLMGYDVPMERNDYEDQTLLRFDAELEDAWRIIEEAGYSLSFSDPPNDNVLTVMDKDNKMVASMHDYELVNKYESLQRKKNFLITAESLLFNDGETQCIIDKVYAFDCQLKALGWSYKIIFEPDPVNKGHGIATAVFKNEDISFKASMEDCDAFINDAESYFKERLQQLLKKSMKQMFVENSIDSKSHSEPIAAHKRTDIDINDEMKKHDDEIMDADDF